MAKKLLCLLLTVMMLSACFVGCNKQQNDEGKEFQTFEEFENAKLGVLTGSEFDRQTQELFPDSEKLQFSNVADLIVSLESDKTDGFLLDTIAIYEDYIGPGDTYKVEYEAELFFEPATARIWDVEVYAAYDYKTEREHKAQVEVLEGETLTCELGEDGLYHATVTGQVKLLTDYESTMYLRVAFYDANGYMYVREWKKTVYGPAERTYTVECTSDAEIVSCKVVYASTLNYSVNY